MSNEDTALATLDAAFGSGLAGMLDDIEESSSAVESEYASEGGGAVDFVGFNGKCGEEGALSPWHYGKEGEETEIDPASVWVVDPTTMEHGWFGFKKGPNGKIIKGTKPDYVFTPWTKRFPEKPADKPWANGRAFKWRAICIESPNPDQVGAYIENTDYRGMKRGYAELERALRERVSRIGQLQRDGRMAEAAELAAEVYPKVQFHFNLRVSHNYGTSNQGIIKHVGWAKAPEMAENADSEDDTGVEVVEAEAVEAEVVDESPEPRVSPATTARRRRRD